MAVDVEAVRRLVNKLNATASRLDGAARQCRNIPDPEAFTGPAAKRLEHAMNDRGSELQRNAGELRGLANVLAKHL